MQVRPVTAFKVLETEFVLELLTRLLANLARRDGTGHVLDRRVRRQVREVVFPLTVERCSPTGQASLPDMCRAPPEPLRCGTPSAMRTRMAAKRASA